MEIRLTNITKSFGSKQVIAPTTLTVESAEDMKAALAALKGEQA